MSLPRYPEYKDSGVCWLGEVPAHWEVKKLKHLATLTTGLTPQSDNPIFYSDDGFPWVRPEDLSENQLVSASKFLSDEGCALVRKIKPFSTLICCIGTIGKIGYVGVEASTNQQITAASFYGYPRYFFYQAISARETFEQSATGNVIKILNSERLGSISFICPSYDEQVLVAHFLDLETAKIDALIAEQEKLIALLSEKRQATISRAVTRGLDPSVPLKDSGVPWLGKVPAHWDITRLKFVANVQTGIAKGKDIANKETITVPYLRVANVQDGYLALEEIAMIEIEPAQLARYRLQVGDVLMNEGGDFDKLGRGAIWKGEIDDCIHQNHVFAVRPHSISSDWLNQLTSSDYAQFYFMTRSKQSTNLASISSGNIMEMPVLMPPKSEQETILTFIAKANQQADQLMRDAESAIGLLKERRAALISAAVTGKIDVRGLAA